jgi:hypothetical protein
MEDITAVDIVAAIAVVEVADGGNAAVISRRPINKSCVT